MQLYSLYYCFDVPMYHCIFVLVYRYIVVSLYRCIVVYLCIVVLLYRCTTVSLHRCMAHSPNVTNIPLVVCLSFLLYSPASPSISLLSCSLEVWWWSHAHSQVFACYTFQHCNHLCGFHEVYKNRNHIVIKQTRHKNRTYSSVVWLLSQCCNATFRMSFHLFSCPLSF